MEMADSSERKSKQSTLTSLAERVMGRWQQTPMNTIVQRAIRLTDSAISTPLSRAAATEGFVQRVIQAKSETNVWKPRATAQQTAIEGFTDTLVQRFPDISAKYVARPPENGSGEQPNLIHSGGNAANPTMGSVEEANPALDNASTNSGTFDVNQLPSIPSDVLARHKAALQKRSESSGSKPSSTPTSPRPVQRKGNPPSPQLVRPRSKVDYIGSKASNAQPSTSTTPAPTNTTPSAPIQAKAEEPVIQETTPLEEPKWRVRPRAGFQSIPSQATSDSGKSNSVPFAPIQAQKANAEPTPDKQDNGELSDISIAPPTPIQRMAAPPMQDETDDKGGDDFTDSSGGTPPNEPPPPSSLPPTSPLQLMPVMPAPEAASSDVEMPLRAAPKAPLATSNPTEGETENVDAIQIPSITHGIPAKAVRRTPQTPPILRKPTLPIAARPTPETPLASSSSTTPSPIPQGGGDSIAPIQRRTEESTPPQSLQVSYPEQRENTKSLYEDKGVSSSPPIQENDSPLSSAPVQRHAATETTEPLLADPNLPRFSIPEREAMPLRSVESDVAPLQRQAEPEPPTAIEATETTSPPFLPELPPSAPLQRRASDGADTAPSVPSQPTTSAASSEKSTPATPAQRSTSPQSLSDNAQGESAAPLQRKSENPSPVQRVSSLPEASEEPIVVTPASPASPVPGREAMPLRVTDGASPISDRPVQRQTEENPAVTSLPNGDTESVTTSSDTPPLQRVASETTVPPSSPPLQRVASETTVPPSSPHLQRVASETTTVPPSSPPPLPAQPLSGEVVQRQAEESIHQGVNVASTPSVGTPQQEIPPAPQTRAESAVQRVAAEVAPTTTERVEMPLRAEPSGLPTPLQRKEDDAAPTTESGREATSSPTATPLDEAASPAEITPVVQRQSDNITPPPNPVDVTPLPQTEKSAQGISGNPPRSNPLEGDTEAVQRLTAEPNLPASPPPSRSEMPLRHDAAAESPVVQRQSDSESQPTTPSSISVVESEASTVTAMGVSDSTPVAQRKIGDSTASEPYRQSVAAEVAPLADSPEQPTIAQGVMQEKPIQRITAEIPPPLPIFPTREEMPLRHEEGAAAPIQRQSSAATDENTFSNESEGASNRSDTPISDLPVAAPAPIPATPIQRVTQPNRTETAIPTESGSVSDSPTSAATMPNIERGKPIAPQIPLQRVAAENSQPPSAPPTSTPSSNVAEQPSAEVSIVQRETGAFASPQATLPTEADMPLRLPPKLEEPLQRVAEEDSAPATTVPAPARPIQSVEGSAPSPIQRVSERGSSTPPTSQQGISAEAEMATPPPSATQVDPVTPASAKAPPARESALPVQRLALDVPPPVGAVEMPLRSEPSINPMGEADTPAVTSPDSAATNPVVESSIEKSFIADTLGDNAPIQTFRATPEPTIGIGPSDLEMPLRSGESAAPPLQRKEAKEANAGPSLSNTPIAAKGEAPLQRMETAASPPSETQRETPQSESSSAPPIELALRSPIPVNTPLQRVVIPHSEDLEAATDGNASTNATPLQRGTENVSPLGTPPAQGTELPLQNAGSPSIDAAPPPLQRIVAEPASSELPMVQRADMPLREDAPRGQPADMPLHEDAPMIQRAIQNETVAESPESPFEQTGNGATTIAPSPIPPLATTVTAIPPLPESSARPALPLQRKATVKAAKIQRKSNALPLPVAPLRAPIQRQSMEATTKFANPTLTTLPPSETTDEGTESNITGIPIQRWAEEGASLPLQLSPSTKTAVLRRSNGTSTARQPAPLPASSLVQKQAMPLVQRVEDDVIVPPEEEEQEEVYIDLSHLFRENEEQVVYVSEEQAKGTGTAPSKIPSEADALQALQTLADEIYPLLKQMIARERERHRGF